MAKGKKTKGTRDYVLPVYFNPEEQQVLEAVSAARGLRGGTLLKLLLRDELRRLGLDHHHGPVPKRK